MQRHPAFIGLILTVAALPRRLTLFPERGRGDLALYLLVQFLLATLLADTAKSWGRRGGLAGFLPPASKVKEGVVVALCSLVVLLPLHLLTDPAYFSRLAEAASPRLLAAAYPATLSGKVASILYVAGFEVLFFYAFVMAVTVRIGGGMKTAVAAALSVRLLVSFLALNRAGLLDLAPMGLALSGVTGTAIAYCYGRGGFPAAALLACLLRSRILLG